MIQRNPQAPSDSSSTRVFIIAEAGVNHNGDIELAKRLVEAAAYSGADAVKFQTFQADRLVTKAAPKAAYQMRSTDQSESQFEMLKQLELSPADHRVLVEHSRQHGIQFISTPFDQASATLLAELNVPMFKIGSGDLTNLPLLSHVARFGKPVILSTGMSYLSEVEAAVRCLEDAGGSDLVLLHCVSNYPANPADVNLRAMHTMAAAFGVPVGYSDHTQGNEVALAAVALGACMIEKHFTLDRQFPGPDHTSSLEPDEFIELVKGIRKVEQAMGHGRKVPAPSEANTAAVARRSLVAACDIPAGTKLSETMIDVKRPGTGLPAAMRPFLIGRSARHAIPGGSLLSLEMMQ